MSLAQKKAQSELAIERRKNRPQTYYGNHVNYQIQTRKTGERRGRIPHIFRKRITSNLELPLWKDFQDFLDENNLTIKQGIDEAIKKLIYS